MEPLSFREQVSADFMNVLLNVQEFGRICSWNGHPLQIVDSATPPAVESASAPGTLQETKEIICRREDMPHPPKATEIVILDDKKWYVIDIKELLGHYVIPLGRYSS